MAVEVHYPGDWLGRSLNEKLRWLVTVQTELIAWHNDEAAKLRALKWTDENLAKFRSWQRETLNPRLTLIGAQIAILRRGLPQKPPVPDSGGFVPPRYDRVFVRDSLTLAELTAIDLDATLTGSRTASPGPDPLEDFTDGWTELDPNTHIGVAANKLTVVGLARNEDAWIYVDKGASHFGTTFEHLFDLKFISASAAWGVGGVWAVSNVINDVKYWVDNTSQALDFRMHRHSNGNHIFVLEETEAASVDEGIITQGTQYYPLVERTGDTTAESRIYDDSGRTSLVDTLNVSVTAGRSWRNLFGCVSYNTATGETVTFDFENLDLQEAAPSGIVVLRRRRM